MKKELVPFDMLLLGAILLSMIVVGYNTFVIPYIPPVSVTYTETKLIQANSVSVSLYPTVEDVLEEYSINMNSADLEKLTQLPGIGVVLGQRIIDYREEHGPFATMEALTQVKGIGDKTVEKLREYAYVA